MSQDLDSGEEIFDMKVFIILGGGPYWSSDPDTLNKIYICHTDPWMIHIYAAS